MKCREVTKISELSKKVKEQEYVDQVRMDREKLEHQEIKSVEEE